MVDTFIISLVYVYKDGAVTTEITEQERDALFTVSEESGASFVDGEDLGQFAFTSSDNKCAAIIYGKLYLMEILGP